MPTTTSPLLIQEYPLQVLPSLAVRVGLEETIVLQQVHYWLTVQAKSQNEYVFKDGHYWVYNTIEEWQAKEFNWWSVPTVRRLFHNLENMGFLSTDCFDKGKRHNRKWYTINYSAVEQLLDVPESTWQLCTENRIKLIQSFITRSNRSTSETTRSNRSSTTRSNRSSTTRSNRSEPLYIQKDQLSETTLSETTLPPIPPQGGNESVGKENLTSQAEEPGTGIQLPEDEFCNQVDSPRLGYLSAPVEKHVVNGMPLDYETLLPSLATIFNQPDSPPQPINPHEEHCFAKSLIGNKAMELEEVRKNELESLIGNKAMELGTVGKNQLERATQIAFRQNFDPARAQTDEAKSALATREPSTGDKYSARVRGREYSLPRHSSAAAIDTKIAAPQTHRPASFSNQPELSRVVPNNFGPAEHDAVLPTRKIALIETSPPVPHPSQHQAPARLQTDSRFHPRSVASREQENRFDPNQVNLPKNLDGSDRMPWDTNKRGVFDQAFENHMARSLMQYPAYRDLMAGELITKVRKHISAGRYDLKRRDELLIEWEAMQNPAHNDFSKASSTLTAKGAARRAKIARALNMKDYL